MPAARLIYQIFVPSFCDGDGDGVGDLKGVFSKLEYIASLGTTHIWLSPIHPSPSYHKYDVQDYYRIDPVFGDRRDFKKVIQKSRELGMGVLLDLVINHTSDLHPWFQQAMTSERNPYHQYYVWRAPGAVRGRLSKGKLQADSDNRTQWHQVRHLGKYYYGYFSNHMPQLNFDFVPAKEEVLNVARFWLQQGVAGFRLDAAKHLYEFESGYVKTLAFWDWFVSQIKSDFPETTFLGEVWDRWETCAEFGRVLPGLFNFELRERLISAVKKQDVVPLTVFLNSIGTSLTEMADDFLHVLFLGNHDTNRIASEVPENSLGMLFSFLFHLPGVPMVYYGDEIQFKGNKPDEQLREPMVWDDPNDSPKWPKSIYNGRGAELVVRSRTTTGVKKVIREEGAKQPFSSTRAFSYRSVRGKVIIVSDTEGNDVGCFNFSSSWERVLVQTNRQDSVCLAPFGFSSF